MVSRLLLVALLASAASAIPSYLTDPNLRWVSDWKRASAERRSAAKHAGCPMAAAHHEATGDCSVGDIVARATSTRGSQPLPTEPCFNVYQIAAPKSNPSAKGPDGTPNHGYVPPGSNDVRSPCPALNTLANHGYLPRDGRTIDGEALINAFQAGRGIDASVINVAATNALAVCSFQGGGSENDAQYENCEAFDLNVLNEPHQFEHDHSLSRQDFEESTRNSPSNNHIFNGTVFNQSLAALGNDCYMRINQANEVRLRRESEQFVLDKPGWLTLAPGVQETELGFIFAVVSENNQPGGDRTNPEPSVRVSWWQYWFMYESFPTPLGWQSPSPVVSNAFVTSVSSRVISAPITSTPTPYHSEFRFGPTGSTVHTDADGATFQPMLVNLYTANAADLKKRGAKVTPTPDPQVFAA